MRKIYVTFAIALLAVILLDLNAFLSALVISLTLLAITPVVLYKISKDEFHGSTDIFSE